MSGKDKDAEIQGKKCFIITPIGEFNSEIFRKAKGVIDSAIKPVLRLHGFVDIKPAYEIIESGMIGNQIIDRIVNDDLVVANLTGNNPNVMYELAIRHATAKPVIHICEKGTILPFDIKDNRTVFFKDDMLGVQELQMEFEDYVNNIKYEYEYKDNPIYNGIQTANIFKRMYDGGHHTEAELLQKILDMVSGPKIESINVQGGMSICRYYDENHRILIRIDECELEDYDEIIMNIKKEMQKLELEFYNCNSDAYYFNNPKKIELRTIKQIMDVIESKYEAKIICREYNEHIGWTGAQI